MRHIALDLEEEVNCIDPSMYEENGFPQYRSHIE
jgi:hypothetical protein